LSAYPAGHRFIYTIDASGVITVYVDGVASTTVTSPGNWVSGGSLVFGVQANAGSDGWAGLMADWGIATGLASAANIARLDLYLKNKGRL
jgi:hypothetical protein